MLITTSNSLLKDIAEVPSNGTISNYSIKCSKISDGENNSDITVSSSCVDNTAAAAHSSYDSSNGNDNETVNDNDNDEQEKEKEAEDETTADGSITDDSILMLMSRAKSTNYGNIVQGDGIKQGSYRRLFPWLLLKSRKKAPLSPLLSSKKGKGKNDEYWRRSIQGPMRKGSVMEMVFYNVQNAP